MSVANTFCLKCKCNINDKSHYAVKTYWDHGVTNDRWHVVKFCLCCYDLTNKIDKYQLMIEDLYTLLPAYAFLRPSVPPPPQPFDCNSKSGPAPPDTTPTPSNDNTTLEQAQSIIIRMQGQRAATFEEIEGLKKQRDNAIQQCGELNEEKKKWEKEANEWESRYDRMSKVMVEQREGKEEWYIKYVELGRVWVEKEKAWKQTGEFMGNAMEDATEKRHHWKNKYNELQKEYQDVYQKEYRTLQDISDSQETRIDELVALKEVMADRISELKTDETRSIEQIKVLEEKLAERTCPGRLGHTPCLWMNDWTRDHQDWLREKKVLEGQVKELEDKLQGRGVLGTQGLANPPGWYPCPFSWNPETSQWERPEFPTFWMEWSGKTKKFLLKKPLPGQQ